jgi:two-component system, cell cycle response regulator
MKNNVALLKIEDNGLIIISVTLALTYWYIESLSLGAISERMIIFFLFIGYGVFTQYLINSNKRMADEISTLSITDHLTGIYNRRGFITLAEQQLKMAVRTKKGVLMLLFSDLDRMKSINDKLGHAKGDKALIEVASILKEVFRDSDIIARVGGDEFAVLAIGAKENSWDTLESRLQNHIDIHNAMANRDYKISLSVGIAYSDLENYNSIDALMSKADALMYEQKRIKRQ